MTKQTVASGRAYNTAVLIVRHPEHELHYEFYGDEPFVVELDLGAGFDITHPREEDQEAVAEWVQGIRSQLLAAGIDADDKLCLDVEDHLGQIMELYDLTDDEEGNVCSTEDGDVTFVEEADDITSEVNDDA